MATIRRTDIIQKKYSKGRPAKTKREISHKRQEAYKWRDARRVYLASSFDRWRKLRCTLKMKDSSLAWHLMEAHEKSPCTLCRQLNSESIPGRQNISMKNNKKEFLPSLIASVRQLCHRYFDFEDSIEIVGLLCLEFDKCRKENFSLNELIKSGLKPAVISESLQDKSSLSNHAINTNLLQSCNDIQMTENSELFHKQQSALPCLLNNSDIYAQSNEITKTADKMDHSDGAFERLSVNDHVHNTCPEEIPLLVSVKNNNVEVNKDIDSQYTELVEDNSISKVDCSLSSDTDPSLEIDIEKMDTSQEEETEKTDSQGRLSNKELLSSSENVGSSLISEESCENTASKCVVEKSSETYVKCQSENKSDIALEQIGESPLDMSMLKSTVKQEPDYDGFDQRPFTEDSDNVHLHVSDPLSHQTHHHSKKKVIDLNHIGSNKHLFWNEHFHNKFGKHKDEMHAGIPWQRRDMSRKEEYEYLEFHPFCDLAEFSQHYPHVHQRTYYRWKRRIKEEFIILEQCPDMSFQEFTSIVLQAKESVYHLWKSLISQGKGFFTPCDSSKRLEAKCSNKPVSTGNELSFLQKNLSINYDQFCQQYPGVSLDVFNVMKRKVMQEFWLYYQNQHMSFKDFSKLVNITEEVFVVWKDYVENLKSSSLSPNHKSAAAVLSPSPSIPPASFQHLDSPKSSSSNMHPHLSEDRILNIINGGSPFSDSVSTGHNTTSLNESIARNLSASYIASLQSMMFPWQSYYGMSSPLGQQILPMMLWPQMIGLGNPLNIIPGSNSASAALTSLQMPSMSNSESPVYESKSDDTNNKPQSVKLQGTKRSATDESDDTTLNCDKKFKVSYDKEDADYWGSISRSRKQNKQEYVYYLKNPELGFKELESLFPSISLRTFYRWRKEMNAAVLLLEDNKDMAYHQFQMVFPDIPEEVFDLWKDKSDKNSALYASKVDSSFGDGSSQNDVYADASLTSQPVPVKAIKERNESSENTVTSFKANVNDDTTHHRKYNKEEYIFVQKNPDIDFATFSKIYPNISVRSFYRWKKELKDSVEYLKGNPSITYDVFRSMDSSATEEIFNIWKTLAFNEYLFEDPSNESSEILEDKELKPLGLTNRKYNGPEYNFLQLNPYIEFSQFSRTYPDVPKRTFYRWKREIQQIINYIKAQPNVNFSDISAILPEVSHEVFQKWKETAHYLVDGCADNNNADNIIEVSDSEKVLFTNANDETTRNKMTDALLYLMRHPTISFRQFSTQFDCILPITFELWLKRIQKVLVHITSNPNITYSSFSSNIKDITEDIFDIWKNLEPEDIAAIEVSCELAQKVGKEQGLDNSMADIGGTSFVSEDILQKGYDYCQNNPSVTDKVFHLHFPGISTKLFNEWKLQINDEINLIKCNPEITFEEFTKSNPHINRDIFNLWKYQSLFKVEDDSHKSLTQTTVDCDQNTNVESVIGQAGCVKVELDASLITHANEAEHDKLENNEDELDKTETCDAGSSLIKQTKFADKRGTGGEKSSVTALDLLNHKKKSLKNLSVAENIFKNNNTIGLHVQSEMSPCNVEGLMHSSNSTGSFHQLYNKTGPLLEAYGSNLLSSTASNSSLSALMAMSGNSDACNPTSQEKITPKKEQVLGNNWQGSTWGYVKDEDEAFSSQRQKKMSRAEYMFVKDNPDVDSQEFSRIFPQVSARTFYRWKKEIKAQLQMA